MHLPDVDRKLDIECKITINKEGRLFSISKANDSIFPTIIRERDGTKVLVAKIPKNVADPSIYGKESLSFNGSAEGSIVEIPTDSLLFHFISSLRDVPSLSSMVIEVEKGDLVIIFRMHSNFLNKLSEVLGKKETLRRMVKDIYLGPSKGFMYHLSDMKLSSRVSIIEYETSMDYINDESIASLLIDGGIAEVSIDPTGARSHKLILYGAKTGKYYFPVIVDEGSSIYESQVTAPLMKLIQDLYVESFIVRYYGFYRAEKGKLRIIVFVGKDSKLDHIDETFKLFSRTHETVSLTLSSDLNEDIWKLL
ncbi:MAG: hypothetical protein M1290_01410 [Candidatus Thermoplasmatota archaeon]|jgi:hypothetical protein|nr:hypothetical protein [Candidatus Thermoplasmatota archaeon]MCL5789106.1 hypothetical protein [Candidatus Thermoplasmatota archaeon]